MSIPNLNPVDAGQPNKNDQRDTALRSIAVQHQKEPLLDLALEIAFNIPTPAYTRRYSAVVAEIANRDNIQAAAQVPIRARSAMDRNL